MICLRADTPLVQPAPGVLIRAQITTVSVIYWVLAPCVAVELTMGRDGRVVASRSWQRPQTRSGLLLTISLVFLAQQALGVELETIVLTGQGSPDGNGTYLSLGFPTLNSEGELAFAATLTALAPRSG